MDFEKPLVSIITVSFNAASSIEKTILSIINQTYSNIEFIIVDGGSTDGTLDLIRKYEKDISYWISEPDKGIYDAMNKGVNKATGEWVNFMNAGDTFYSHHTIKEISHLFDKKTDVVYGAVNMVYESYNIIEEGGKNPSKNKPMPFNHQSSFVRRKLLVENKFITSFRYAADYNFFNTILPFANYKRYNNVIASYTIDGISSQNAIEVNRERIIINPCVYNYYNHFLCYRNYVIKRIMNMLGLKSMINIIIKAWKTK